MGKKPNLSHLRPRGSADVHNPTYNFRKLEGRSKKKIFIRYLEHAKCYVFISEHESATVTELEAWVSIF